MDIQSVLQTTINKKGSDIHLRVGGVPHIRIDGQLTPFSQEILTQALVEDILKKLITPHAKKIFDEKGECDFSFEVENIARFRVNAFHQRGRLSLAIRYIPVEIPSFQGLRLPGATLRKIADLRRGLVLVTGATGSGKSSTLAAMVDAINETRPCHILTVEDPIEFLHKDKKAIITQREIGQDTESFAEGLRMALRQDPDVILLGEMRDLETTMAALTAAQTGHLVLATMHTVDTAQTITRIIDLYPPHQQNLMRKELAETLKAVISQRLLPCSKGGRVPALEIMIVTAHIKKLIEDNDSNGIAQAIAKGQFYGMQTFNQSLFRLFKDGLASENDIMEAASSPDDLRLAMKGIEQEIRMG
jgi:twitching motility protein PilT